MLNRKKNNKGFTLVELLVVIAIIGILAVVAVPALFKNIDKAKVADLESDISALKSSMISYVSEQNKLPANLSTTDMQEIKTAVGQELDTLSNPYGASYAITTKIASSTAVANILGAGEGAVGDVVLTITLSSALSDAAVTKLETDLASMKVSNVTDGIVSTDKKVIKVLLMNGAGLEQMTS